MSRVDVWRPGTCQRPEPAQPRAHAGNDERRERHEVEEMRESVARTASEVSTSSWIRARSACVKTKQRASVRARGLFSSSRPRKSTSNENVTPGKGPGAPSYAEIHAFLVQSNRCTPCSTSEVADALQGRVKRVAVVDVRQSLEFEEWRLPGTVNAPYLIPFENVLRRASGYFLAIKGGLKERNPRFVDAVDAVVGDKRQAIILLDLRGGDLSIEPKKSGTSGTYDRGDSNSLRAAYELIQCGYTDVRYVPGGLTACVEEGVSQYESERYGALLAVLPDGVRKSLLFSNLLPDPSLAPGFIVQFIALAIAAYLNV